MGEHFEGCIWRPGSKLVATGSPTNQEQVQTRTSLAYDHNSNMRNLNKEILSASQLYNNTPKPFTRNEPDENGTSLARPKNFYENQISSSPHIKVTSHQSSASDIENMRRNKTTLTPREDGDPSPKLVHKQYNSPIDLYSMNNIRKTIEAHTELIAPGLKGINFMKPDSAYNKQSSEVYKLIKEEEERKMGQCCSKSVSPISGHPVDSSRLEQHVIQHASQEGHCSRQCSTPIVDSSSCSKMSQPDCSKSTLLSCFECGNKIRGVFAKVADRFIHPDCFKCTTCGTSLKNVGFFTVSEKLYCRVHAEQVAKMMRISYDFNKETSIRTGNGKQEQPNEAGCSTIQQQSPTRKPTQSIGLAGLLSTSTTSKFGCTGSEHQVTNLNANHECKESKQQSLSGNNSSMASTFKQTGCTSNNFNFGQSLQKYSEQVSYEQQSSSRKTTIGQYQDRKLDRVPVCTHCCVQIHGPYILAGKTTWCKQCSQTHFTCNSCRRSLLDVGFIEDGQNKQYCEHCFEAYYAPICSKCNLRVKGDCLNALGKQWHPSCFVCGHCKRPFGNSSFYLEDNIPYCERDWNLLFTTKCFSCSYPIETGDKWIEALDRSYHSGCFRCTSCQVSLEDSTFYCKGGKPYCRLHVR